jgi:thiol-disulfide isomerase/thioredoxin
MRNRLRILALICTLLPFFIVLAAAEPEPARKRSPSKDEARSKLPDLKPEQLADPKAAAEAADALEKAYAGKQQPESVRMLLAILRGPNLGPRDGWFGPAETRFTWKWLVGRSSGEASAKAVSRQHFRGPEAYFKTLDRDGDGQITPGDLDWSEQNPWVQQAYLVNRIFRRMNAKGDGKLTREDLDEFFKRVSKGKDHITSDDLRAALLFAGPADDPSVPVLVRALYASELGSLQDGPHLDEAAPDFTLKSPDGKQTIQLSKLMGPKPVVLVFGNFTCGPFRSFYPDVDAVYQRYKDDAVFLMVYVREAHPTDGWKMEANDRVGVAVKQPTNYEERVKVCDQFCGKLKPSMPVVVDTIDDTVGNAYSGMPARMYVIDAHGKVAFKSGRGPFGFRVGEMEQALMMALMEHTASKKP